MYPQGRGLSCIVVLVELPTYYGERQGHLTRAVEANHDRKESIYSNELYRILKPFGEYSDYLGMLIRSFSRGSE